MHVVISKYLNTIERNTILMCALISWIIVNAKVQYGNVCKFYWTIQTLKLPLSLLTSLIWTVKCIDVFYLSPSPVPLNSFTLLLSTRMTYIEYISRVLWLQLMFKSLEGRRREGSGIIPQDPSLVGLLGQSVSFIISVFLSPLKMVSSPWFSLLLLTQSCSAPHCGLYNPIPNTFVSSLL